MTLNSFIICYIKINIRILNCSDVAEDSDSDHNTAKQTHTRPSTLRTSVSTSGIDSALQQQINVQILSQLSAINDRLNAIESTNSKKTSDPKKIKKSKQKISSQVCTCLYTATTTGDKYNLARFTYN